MLRGSPANRTHSLTARDRAEKPLLLVRARRRTAVAAPHKPVLRSAPQRADRAEVAAAVRRDGLQLDPGLRSLPADLQRGVRAGALRGDVAQEVDARAAGVRDEREPEARV